MKNNNFIIHLNQRVIFFINKIIVPLMIVFILYYSFKHYEAILEWLKTYDVVVVCGMAVLFMLWIMIDFAVEIKKEIER